MDPDVTV